MQPADPLPATITRARRLALFAILALTFLVACWWSYYKLFWIDELLEFYSDARPSFAAVLTGQLRTPFSLEPPAFHLLLHGLQLLLPSVPEFATRLPGLVSLPVTELCCFLITLRLTRNSQAALVAAIFPFFLVTIDYAPEARVYGLLTAFFAIALLCYQSATLPGSKSRTLPLLGLFASLGAAILLHYNAILFPLPILAAEALRTARRRRLDLPLLASLAAAFLLCVLNLPSLRPLHEIQAHYYNTGETRWPEIAFTYVWFVGHFRPYAFLGLPHAHLLIVGSNGLALVAVLLLSLSLWRRLSRAWDAPDAPVLTAVGIALLLPFFTLAIAHFITHAYQPRYTLPACVGLAILVPVLVARYSRVLAPLALALLLSSLLYGYRHVRLAEHDRNIRLAEEKPSPALLHAFTLTPDPHIYFQDLARYLTMRRYAEATVQPRFLGFYSDEKELFWLHRDPTSLFARNMSHSTDVPFLTYNQLRAQPGPHLLVVYHDPMEEWIDRDLEQAAQAQPLGSAFGGTLYLVTFHPALAPPQAPGGNLPDAAHLAASQTPRPTP